MLQKWATFEITKSKVTLQRYNFATLQQTTSG
jgi:hypothetical protein